MSKESTAAVAALTTFQADFSTFSADAVRTLNNIATAGAVDPADKAALSAIATGLGAVAVTLADLDTKIKAADPGAVPVGLLTITDPTSLPQSIAGHVYPPVTFKATGGSGGYGFTATGLPSGLALSPSGVLTGAPDAAGSANVVVTVTDSAGGTAFKTFSLSIAAAPVGP